MLNLIKVIFTICLSIFIFTGCTTKVVQGDNLAINQYTIQNPKKNITFDVKDIKLSGNIPKYWDGLPINQDEVKKSLKENLDKFYPKNSTNTTYEIDLIIDFNKKTNCCDALIATNGIYKIRKKNNIVATLNIDAEYLAEMNFSAKKFTETLFFGLDRLNGGINNEEFKKTLEQTGYALNEKTPLTSYNATERFALAYAGAIRFNFAKFIQELNKLDLK